MSDQPIMARYEGDGNFSPAAQFWAGRADKQYVVGEVYRIGEIHDRSWKSHRHFFAAVNEAWKNMPDELLDEYPTAETLRKKALIRKGYRDERTLVCASKAEAERVAAFVRPSEEYAIVTFRDAVVRVWTAQSQSVKAMGARDFQKSKQDVLDFVAALIGVPVDTLASNAGMAA